MSDFLSEIKKIPTCDIIRSLSYISINMFKSVKSQIPLKLVRKQSGVMRYADVILLAWDIPSIEFLSVQNSNDYRNSHKKTPLAHLVNYYRGYENEHSSSLKGADFNTISRTILGMTAEQFAFQEMWRLFEKFNRDYHI